MTNSPSFRLFVVPTRLVKALLVAAIFVLFAGGVFRAQAAELVMFESSACAWCEAWNNDIGVVYDKTPESTVLPLRRVDIDGDRPGDLKNIGGIIYTPTFIVLEDGKEIGRILGYPGEDFFWQLLGEIVRKVENKLANKS